MKEILDKIAAAVSAPLRANSTEDLGRGVIYEWHTVAFDGVKETVRLKLSIVAETMEETLAMLDAVNAAIVPVGDNPLTGRAPVCRLNGGGWLSDGERHVRIAYYELILKRS